MDDFRGPAAEAELIAGIHAVNAPDSGQSGMTLDSDEVAILARLLPARAVPAPDYDRLGIDDPEGRN